MTDQSEGKSEDRRVLRTRRALIGAFNDLLLKEGRKDIRVADIIEKANVGRSTFYEHFSNADDLEMQALAYPMSALADALTGAGDAARLEWLLDHFWENRQRARAMFAGQKRDQVARLLAGQVEERLAPRGEPVIPLRLASLQLAESALAVIRGWLLAEAPSKPARLAAGICATSTHTLAALYPDA